MIDDYKGHQSSLTGPATAGEAITPSNSNNLPFATRAIYVGEAGDISVELISGNIVKLTNVAAGVIYPLRVKRVRSSGTTAGGLVGLR
ncbi:MULTISPECIES: spike base protein, RCAP_Rcc01079 family [unclassified Dinoroseobacter]|uniref:spike base protein, RCAP_Rcc01079 family n=1 Tax=unclassified Dinoroseobacter TaxID=2620028 RepID=UPI003C7CE7C0